MDFQFLSSLPRDHKKPNTVHLFLSSLLALVASFFTWFQTSPEMNSPWMSKACLLLHWIFISLAIAFFLIAMLRLLAALVRDSSEVK